MAHAFKKILSSFFKRPDLWFFSGFLLTFPLTTRKVLLFYPINDAFNEYTGIYLYLSDIFLLLTIISWFIILCNKYSILSILKCSTWNILESIFKKRLKKGINEQLQISSEKYDKQDTPASNAPRLPRSNKLFHVEQFIYFWSGTFIMLKKLYQQIINNYAIIFPLLLAIFSFLSILWTNNKPIALFRSIKLFEFILLYFYIIYNVPRPPRVDEQPSRVEAGGTFLEKIENKKCSTPEQMFHPSTNVPRGTLYGTGVEHYTGHAWNIFGGFLVIIIISGFIQSIIGFLQFFRNSSLGLIWLKESVLSPEISGVAKIIFDGIVHIRSYGLFPHPNVFGGFLIFSIIATLLYFKMFHACPAVTKCSTWNILFTSGVEHFEKNLSQAKLNSSEPNCSTWNNLKESMGKNVPRGTFLMHLFILIQATALLLTFSKSAIIGLFIGFLYIAANNVPFNVPRPPRVDEQPSRVEAGGTFSKDPMFKMFHVEHFWRKVFLAIVISVLLLFIFKPDMQTLFLKSLNERITYLNVSRRTFFENPFFGTGIGQFVPNLKNVANLETWQFQPVHNVFLLILNELGIFIFFGFIFFIYKIFRPSINVPPQYKCSTPVQMFHPSTNVPRGTLYGASVEHCTGQAWNI